VPRIQFRKAFTRFSRQETRFSFVLEFRTVFLDSSTFRSTPAYLRDVAVDRMAAGAARAGRDPSKLEITSVVTCRVGKDRAAVLHAARETFMERLGSASKHLFRGQPLAVRDELEREAQRRDDQAQDCQHECGPYRYARAQRLAGCDVRRNCREHIRQAHGQWSNECCHEALDEEHTDHHADDGCLRREYGSDRDPHRSG